MSMRPLRSDVAEPAEREGNRPRQTNLAAVGRAAQQQIETGMSCLSIDFRRVR